MKNTAMFWVANTTITLVIVYMVYKVLTDNFVTEKTFKDIYEDHPIGYF